jgi:hypothetical protein
MASNSVGTDWVSHASSGATCCECVEVRDRLRSYFFLNDRYGRQLSRQTVRRLYRIDSKLQRARREGLYGEPAKDQFGAHPRQVIMFRSGQHTRNEEVEIALEVGD